LALLLWACGKAEHHGKELMVEQSCSHRGDREVKERRSPDPNNPFKFIDLTSFHQLLSPKGSTTSQQHHELGTMPSTCETLQDIGEPNCNSKLKKCKRLMTALLNFALGTEEKDETDAPASWSLTLSSQ
jgi:hypothetical protein